MNTSTLMTRPSLLTTATRWGRSTLGGLGILGLAACGTGTPTADGDPPDVTSAFVSGEVSDGAGQKSLGGSGSIDATTQVRATHYGPAGEAEVVDETELSADGSFTLALPPSEEHFVLAALDAEGNVVASAIFEQSGVTGTTRTSEPFTSESSLEAEVFQSLHRRGHDASSINTVEIRNRVDADMATTIDDRDLDEEELRADVDLIADAVWAADRAKTRVYADVGITATSEQRWQQQLNAVLAYHETLAANDGDAHADLQAAVESTERSMDADDEVQARAEIAASAAFRGVVSALDDLETEEACDQEAAENEARKTSAATVYLLAEANASSMTITDASQAGADLRTAVEEADSRAEINAAFDAYTEAMVGTDDSMSATVLEALLEVDLASEAAAALALETIADARAVLVDDVDDALATATDAGVVVDAEAWGEACADAYLDYYATLEAQADVFTALDQEQGSAGLDIAVVTEGSFRGAY